jgi:hypothetical protein
MGQAKKKNEKRKKDHLLSKPLSLARFNLYTLGTRFSMARVMSEELSWWADLDEKLIGFVFRDTTDNDCQSAFNRDPRQGTQVNGRFGVILY